MGAFTSLPPHPENILCGHNIKKNIIYGVWEGGGQLTLKDLAMTANLQKHLEGVGAAVCEPFNPILRGCFVQSGIFPG